MGRRRAAGVVEQLHLEGGVRRAGLARSRGVEPSRPDAEPAVALRFAPGAGVNRYSTRRVKSLNSRRSYRRNPNPSPRQTIRPSSTDHIIRPVLPLAGPSTTQPSRLLPSNRSRKSSAESPGPGSAAGQRSEPETRSGNQIDRGVFTVVVDTGIDFDVNAVDAGRSIGQVRKRTAGPAARATDRLDHRVIGNGAAAYRPGSRSRLDSQITPHLMFCRARAARYPTGHVGTSRAAVGQRGSSIPALVAREGFRSSAVVWIVIWVHGVGPMSQRTQKGLRGLLASRSAGGFPDRLVAVAGSEAPVRHPRRRSARRCPPGPDRSSMTSHASGSVAMTKPNSAPSEGRESPSLSAVAWASPSAKARRAGEGTEARWAGCSR